MKTEQKNKSLVSAIYEKYMAFLGKEVVYPTDAGAFSFRYSSGVSEYENISLIDVLDGTIPPQAFDNRVVLVCAVTIAAKLFAGYLLFGAGYSWDNLSAVLMSAVIGIYLLHFIITVQEPQS